MNVSGVNCDMLEHMTFVFLDDEQRAYLKQEGLTDYAKVTAIVANLKCAREKAKRDAIANLGRYKFSNFGYHAARWVTLNKIIGDKQPNPFRKLVDAAKSWADGSERGGF